MFVRKFKWKLKSIFFLSPGLFLNNQYSLCPKRPCKTLKTSVSRRPSSIWIPLSPDIIYFNFQPTAQVRKNIAKVKEVFPGDAEHPQGDVHDGDQRHWKLSGPLAWRIHLLHLQDDSSSTSQSSASGAAQRYIFTIVVLFATLGFISLGVVFVYLPFSEDD